MLAAGRLLIISVLFVSVVFSSSPPPTPDPVCVATCPNTPAEVYLCGQDNVTYGTTVNGVGCLFNCGVGVAFVGSCECPNNCSGSLAAGERGQCVTTTGNGTHAMRCACAAGWGGADCATVNCATNNTCSFHGVCVTANASIPNDVDRCECDGGYTGVDCRTPAFPYSDVPWGCVMEPGTVYLPPGSGCPIPPQSQVPWFDFSKIAVTRLTLDAEAYATIIAPINATSNEYVYGSLTLEGAAGGFVQRFAGVGVHLKGSGSRTHTKKSFTVKFSQGASWSRFSLKAAGSPFGYQLTMSMLMSIGLPAVRTMYTQLYINGIYVGFYIILPDFTQDWLNLWYPNTTGVFYKNAEGHCTIATVGRMEECMEATLGTPLEPKIDLQTLVNFTNNSFNIEFTTFLDNYIDVDNLLRTEMISSFMQMRDGMTDSGNNYQVYSIKYEKPLSSTTTGMNFEEEEGDGPLTFPPTNGDLPMPNYRASFSLRDFDMVFQMVTGTSGWMDSRIFNFPTVWVLRDELNGNNQYYSPLLLRMFSLNETTSQPFLKRYAKVYKTFISQWNAAQASAGLTVAQWYAALVQFGSSCAVGNGFDVSWLTSYNATADLFVRPELLTERIADVTAQIEAAYPSPTTTAPSATNSPQASSSDMSAKIGYSVGAGLVVVVVVIIVMIHRRRQQRRTAESLLMASDHDTSSLKAAQV